jgi:valyl-tRNA synthetase
MPHIAEYVYKEVFEPSQKVNSIHKHTWDIEYSPNAGILKSGEILLNIAFEVRKYKAERSLSLRAPVKSLNITVPQEFFEFINDSAADLKYCAAAEEITVGIGEFKVGL